MSLPYCRLFPGPQEESSMMIWHTPNAAQHSPLVPTCMTCVDMHRQVAPVGDARLAVNERMAVLRHRVWRGQRLPFAVSPWVILSLPSASRPTAGGMITCQALHAGHPQTRA